MSKKNLDNLVLELSKEIKESPVYRNEVDQHTHVYTVDRKKLWRELYNQISGMYVQDKRAIKFYFNNKNAPNLSKVLNEYLDKYIENLYSRASSYSGTKVKVDKSNGGIKKYPDGSFSVRLIGDGQASVFDAVNRIRSETTNSTKYLLPQLRKDVYEAVMASSYIKTLQAEGNSSRIEATVRRRTIGKEYFDPKDNKTKIMGGLFEAGHGTGYSVVEQEIRDSIIEGSSGLEETLKKLPKEMQELGTLRALVSKMTATSKNIVFLFEQGELHNSFRATKERKIRDTLKKEILRVLGAMPSQFWLEYETSSSIKKGVEHTVLSPLKQYADKGVFKNKKGIQLPKLKGIDSKPKSTVVSLKAQVTKTSSEESNKVKTKSKKISGDNVMSTTSSTPQKTWSSLLPMINSKLTPKMIANMRYPALVNRTGTLASSAEVVNVETTKEGFPTFVFNYERDPYNVFDRTLGRSPWNTPERDPRALVDKSVREVLREMAVGRFYTRRA